MDPIVILIIGVALLIALIMVLRVNAFVALITAAIVISLLAPGDLANKVSRVAGAFGTVVGAIGIVIALAAVIGKCMMDSGAADRIVRSFLKVLGEKRSSWALMTSGFVLSIPVFFDTVFYLLVPLARSMWRRTHKDYILYVTVIVAGAGIAHTLIPPTPGPLYMANAFKIDIGLMILMGVLIGLPSAVVGLFVCKLINRFGDVPMRPYSSEPEPEPLADEQLPPLWISLLPIILPVILISANTVASAFANAERPARFVQGDILDWSDFTNILTRGRPGNQTPPGRIMELLPPAVQQSVNKAAADRRPVDDDTQQQLLGALNGILKDPNLTRDAAFAGFTFTDEAEKIRNQGLAGAPEKTIEQFNRLVFEQVFRQQIKPHTQLTARRKAASITAVPGNPNLALLLSAAIAMFTVVNKRKMSLRELAGMVDKALMSGGIIILITAGGGAFGAMLREAGVQTSVEKLVGSGEQNIGTMILLLGFGVAVMIKFAQGSGTVSMITTASMFAAMGITPDALGCNPVYLAMAIGSGSLVGDWMNNSGFWIFARMSVLTEAETLKSWTILTAALGVIGLGFTMLFAYLMPMV